MDVKGIRQCTVIAEDMTVYDAMQVLAQTFDRKIEPKIHMDPDNTWWDMSGTAPEGYAVSMWYDDNNNGVFKVKAL